jgi:drug/metabolite transporter (DMT)-like permease
MGTINNKQMGSQDWLQLFFLSVLWGGSYFFIKVILVDLKPFSAVLGRVFIAAIVLNIIVRATGQRMPTSLKMWGSFFVMGFLNNLLPFSLIFWGGYTDFQFVSINPKCNYSGLDGLTSSFSDGR